MRQLVRLGRVAGSEEYTRLRQPRSQARLAELFDPRKGT
jgi:hypothetical protein